MKKRIAVLLMAAVFSVTSLNLSAASIEQSAGAGVEDAEEKEEGQEEPAPETPDEVEPETPEATELETTEVTEPETPEVTEPETTEVTEPKTPETTEAEAVITMRMPEVSEPEVLEESDSEASKELSDVEKLQKRIDALPDKDALSSMEDEQLEKVYQEISDIYDLINELEDEDKLDLERLQNAAAYFTEQIMALDVSDSMVAKIGDKEFTSLQAAIDAAGDGQEVTITLIDNIIMETADIVTIPNEKNIKLDMAGKSITVKDNFEGRPIVNNGTLTITGNGTIDSSASESGGYGAVNNYGTLTIENGTYRGAKYADGSSVYNRSEAKLTISGGTFENATRAVSNAGEAEITGGTFKGTTCSQCKSEIWAYTIVNIGIMTISGGTVTGVQGAVAVSSGSAEITGGSFKTVICQEDSTHTATFYALYVAGENDVSNCSVSGGTFETEGQQAAVLVGNDNTNGDGGINAKAHVTISGGTFKAPEGVPALKGAPNTGDPRVTGGTFSSAVDAGYCAEGYSSKEYADGTFGVQAGAVASINSTSYATLQEAINEAKDKDVIVLTSNTKESVTVPEDKSITIDLNGKTLTNDKDHTIFNKGNLSIKDSGENGTVDNITHARASLYNEVGATVTMDGGTFIRSKENGITSENNGGNSYYAVLNHGTMTINDGVKVVQSGKYSSLLENGWQNGTQNTTEAPSVLTINGGVFDGGLNTIKNDDYGELKINNGTFTNVAQYAVMNWNIAEIRGGEFSSDASSVVWNGYDNATMDKGQLTITGGTFTAPVGYYVIYNAAGNKGEIQIGGGLYSSQYIINGNPEEHYLTGFAPQLREDGKYGIEPQKVEPIADTVFVDADTDQFDEEQNEILEQLKNINDIAVEGSAVTEAVQRAADQWNENLSANLEEEKAALLEAGVIDQATADSATASVYLYVRPYLYMEVQDIDVTNKVMTVDMEMRYALIASTSPDGDNVITTSVAENTGATANAVILKGGIGEEALLLDIQGSVDITLPYPSMFTSTKLSVKHTKESGAVYYYTSDAAGGTIQFVNPHGFSEFQIREERKAVVSYQNASGTVTEKTYTDADIDSTKIEADSKDGYLFEGWQYAGVEGTYRDTVLTEALLDKLAAAYEQNGNKPVTASPVFTAATAQINITMGMLDKDGKELKTDRTFYAAVFTDKDYKNLYGTVLQFAFQNSSKASTVVVAGVPNDGSSRTFYVTETDKNGNPIQGGKDFGYEIIVKGGTVTLAKDGTAEVTITNKEVKQSSSHKKKSHSSGNDESSAPAAQPASVASAQTGDNSPVALLLVLCIGALSGIAIIMHSRKKKSN